jgi:hypothetical protein
MSSRGDFNLPLEAGMVVLAAVYNPFENPKSVGKVRPAVLVEREGGHWWVMGLTSKSHYQSGKPRTPVPDPARVGLAGPGYLWGDRLTSVSALDVRKPLGWCDRALAEMISSVARLQDDLREDLVEKAELMNPGTPEVA